MTKCTARASSPGRTVADIMANGERASDVAAGSWCLPTGPGTRENGRKTKEMATARCTFRLAMVSLMAHTTLAIGVKISGRARGR